MGNVNMEASQINYRGGQKKMSVEEALKNTSGEAAAIAQLQTDVLNLNSNKANQITIAPFFNAETAYDPGDLVYYNGLSYRCVNAHEGEWDADDFAATTISGEIDSLKSGLTWQNVISSVTFATGITVADARAYANGNMFTLTFLLDITSIAGTGEIVIGNIANTYAPNGKWRFTGMSYSEISDSGTANMISVATSGSISVEHTGGKPYIEGTLLFPLNN